MSGPCRPSCEEHVLVQSVLCQVCLVDHEARLVKAYDSRGATGQWHAVCPRAGDVYFSLEPMLTVQPDLHDPVPHDAHGNPIL